MTKKPRKGKQDQNITPIAGRKEKTVHSHPQRPTGRDRPPKGEDPRKRPGGEEGGGSVSG